MATKKDINIITNAENCVGCQLCQMRCSFRFTQRFSFSDAQIDIDWNEKQCRYDINFKAVCDRCGLCVTACVYGALMHVKNGAKEVSIR